MNRTTLLKFGFVVLLFVLAIALAVWGHQTGELFTMWCSGFLWGLFAWALYTLLRGG